MDDKRLETWVWVLIYGGMIAIALGLAVQDRDAALGWGIAVAGMLVAGAGVVLIWVRSRPNKKG